MKNREKISSNNEQFSKNHSRVDGYATYYFLRHEPCSLEFVSKKRKKEKRKTDIIRSKLKQMDNEFPYFLAEFARE